MIDVIAWPPVGARGTEWTEEAPVGVSRSAVTGADYTSAARRIRRMVSLNVSGRRGGDHAGYMEMLKRFLGGVNAVRLYSHPINKHLTAAREAPLRQSQRLTWSDDGTELNWIDGGVDQIWFSGTFLTGVTGTDSEGWPIVTVSGLAASALVARPGEFLTVFSDHADLTGTVAQIVRPAISNGDGVAVIRLFSALPSLTDVRINLGTSDTGVFKPVKYPRAVQPVDGDWEYGWQFREIFEDEIGAGGFVEVNPW